VLLAGFLMWGLQPGPLLMQQNPEFAWGLIASMYLGNIMLLLINIFMIPAFASVAKVPFRLLAPIVIVLCTLGTFTVHGSIIEVGIMLACGVLGFYMRRFGMSPAALVIALVLGPLAEETLRQTMVVSGGDLTIFLTRTTSVWLLVVIALLLLIPLLSPLVKKIIAVRVREVGRRRRYRERVEARKTPQPEDSTKTDRHDEVDTR
jgi:putative tricarboxylic transport membrane protein